MILIEWIYDTEGTAVPHMSVPPPAIAAKRRFIPIDGFKPKVLSIEANYEDFLDFQKRFMIYAKACYESTMYPGVPGITYKMVNFVAVLC